MDEGITVVTLGKSKLEIEKKLRMRVHADLMGC